MLNSVVSANRKKEKRGHFSTELIVLLVEGLGFLAILRQSSRRPFTFATGRVSTVERSFYFWSLKSVGPRSICERSPRLFLLLPLFALPAFRFFWNHPRRDLLGFAWIFGFQSRDSAMDSSNCFFFSVLFCFTAYGLFICFEKFVFCWLISGVRKGSVSFSCNYRSFIGIGWKLIRFISVCYVFLFYLKITLTILKIQCFLIVKSQSVID